MPSRLLSDSMRARLHFLPFLQIALLISQGKPDEAIRAATEYLDVFQTDAVAWEELAKLYLELGRKEQGHFCLEECVMHNPGNAASMLQLADLLYAQGGVNFQAARGYYAKVVEMSGGDNQRALAGVVASDEGVQDLLKTRNTKWRHGDSAVAANAALAEACRQRLQQLQTQGAPA